MKTKYSSLFSLPYLIWSLIFIIVPMGLVVVFAFIPCCFQSGLSRKMS